MVIRKNILLRLNISVILPVILLLHVNVFSQEDYSNWNYSARVYINTGNTGANVSGNVSDFPLLVRLTNSNFDFSLAKTNGEDIRFSKSTGEHLFYEIERWNNGGQVAEIWVLVDLINGSDSTQYINVYWGKADAVDSSNSVAVFATSDSYEGVWHLNEDPTGGVNPDIKDRTGNAYHGTAQSMSTSGNATGTIGLGIDFDGVDDRVRCGSGATENWVDDLNTITIGAWIYPTGWGGGSYGRIVDKSDAGTGLCFFISNTATGGYETSAFNRDRVTTGTDARPAQYSFSLNQWTYLVVTMNGTSSTKIYYNGSEVSSYFQQILGSGSLISEAHRPLYIGNRYNTSTLTVDRHFDGIIDEVRISSSVRSDNWIKLNYETQKSGQISVIVKHASFTLHPQSDTVDMGDPVTFVVTAVGKPAPTYQWQTDASGAWQNISGATDSIYNIPSATVAHTGNYRAIAGNSVGKDTSNEANLFVRFPPSFTTQPQSDTVDLGDNASFTVVADGYPNPTYQWQKLNGVWGDIASETNTTLSFSPAQLSDIGWYRAVAANALGTDISDSAYLMVTTTPPTFDTHPQHDTVHVSESASFTATASGNPTPTYQWQTNTSGSWTDISGETGTTYTIASATLANTGYYRSVAANIAGTDTSDSAYLLVYDSTNIITSHPANDTVLVGGTAIFGVTATGTDLLYQWQRKPSGGSFSDIAGATDDTLNYVALAGDDDAWFRCVVTTGPANEISNVAILTLGTIPTITSSFSNDTVIPVGGSLTLVGAATAIPPPSYEWFFIFPGSAPVTIGTGIPTLSLTAVADNNAGTYYFVASNQFGSTSSDSIFVHVLTPVIITTDLPSSYTVIHGGAASLSIVAAGDSTINYQWYESDTVLPGQASSNLSINPVDSAIHEGNTYHCQVWNTYLGVTVGTARSVTCTLKVGDFYNPFKVKVERIDIHNTTQVRVKLWSEVDISGFPTTGPFNPWCDSVWVLYNTNNYPTGPQQANTVVAMYSTDEIKQAADTVTKTLTVQELMPGGVSPFQHDSCYWFNQSALWHVPSAPDTLLRPLIQANKVFMLDTTGSPNLLVVHGEYIMMTDSALIIIDSIQKLNQSLDSLLVVLCSEYPDFSTIKLNDTLTVPNLIASGSSDTIIMTALGTLPIETNTMYCRWFIIGTNTSVGEMLDTSFVYGWDRPVYAGTLTADSTYKGDELHLEWTAPQAGTDSVRIWWNTSPIDTIHNPTLPIAQAFYPESSVTIDTITNVLTNNTVYYVGLQIFKDDFWSVITSLSSDTAKTALGNPDTVPNVISVDSTGFDSTRNSMLIYWHIDLSTVPAGQYYQSGYTFEPDSILDTANIKPTLWDSVASAQNVTEIILYPEIWFDTVYAVGMWLRAYSPPLGPTRPAYPTDSSYKYVQIPSFTWQVVNIFPVDTVYAANRKIVLAKQITDMNITDTLWAFHHSGALPAGFVDVGSVPFTFYPWGQQPAPFKLGLKYGTLPIGITESDLAMYQVKNNEFHVLYGSGVSNGAVWASIDKDSIPYPFIVLADTTAPVITVSLHNDTITKGFKIPTLFSVEDNVANAHWEFKYGQGNEAYVYGTGGYLAQSNDTTLMRQDIDTGVINESFGVRAIIVAEDGVGQDTANVSRCVKSTTGESFIVGGKEWVPLRSRKGLSAPSLEIVFDRSVEVPDPWVYDIYESRIYRWHNIDPLGVNTWLEYSDVVKNVFDFIPGRVIWCKTAEDQLIKFGEGVTTTLKEAYRITLKPNNWTDISSPFQFPVMLGDVLETTTPFYDSLEVYHWIKDTATGVYIASDVFIYAFDTLTKETDTLMALQRHDGYTVYNHYDTAITLLIPPISLPLSKYSAQLKGECLEENPNSWDISFNWKDADNESFFKRVRCGYKKGEGEAAFGSLPPSMSTMQVGVLDKSSKRVCGWELKRGFDKNGGLTFEISMNNNAKKSADIEYYLDNLTALPEDFIARVYDSKSGEYEECSEGNASSVAVKANGSKMRILAIGPQNYFNNLFAAFLPMKLLKAYPNPFNGLVKIHYRIPFGIREVQFTLYNLQGQRLWRGSERKYVTAGEHIFYLNSRKAVGNKALPAGVYILRLSAKNSSGKTLYGGKKMITCIK